MEFIKKKVFKSIFHRTTDNNHHLTIYSEKPGIQRNEYLFSETVYVTGYSILRVPNTFSGCNTKIIDINIQK